MKKIFVALLLTCMFFAGCGEKDSSGMVDEILENLSASESQIGQEKDDSVILPGDNNELPEEAQNSGYDSTESIIGSITEIGSDTPEEAAQRFVEAISNNDLFSALAFFDCTHKADNFDYVAYINKIGAWNPNTSYRFDTSDEMFADAIYEMSVKDAAYNIFNLCFSLKADEEYLQGQVIFGENFDLARIASDLDDFTELDKLDTFKIVRMDYSKPEMQNSAANKKAVNENCGIYGAEEAVEYGVLYEYDGSTYFGGMCFYKYDEKWYIDYLNAVLAGQNSYGYLTPMSEEEYLEQVSD